MDANVFEQVEGRWQVRADAAWDHVLTQRPYILDWITDVAKRAERLGKTLLAFSHYPALPLTLVRHGDHYEQTGTQDWLKRMPSLKSGRSLAHAGVRWHFSGHMHVAREVEFSGLLNVAVPSPVAYPGGYVEIICENNEVEYNFIRVDPTPGFGVASGAYHKQYGRNGPYQQWTDALNTDSFAGFLQAHLVALIESRHIPSDWPPKMQSKLGNPLVELFCSLRKNVKQANHGEAGFVSLRQMLLDYYFLRANDPGAMHIISADRIKLYRSLSDIASSSYTVDRTSDQIELLLTMLSNS